MLLHLINGRFIIIIYYYSSSTRVLEYMHAAALVTEA